MRVKSLLLFSSFCLIALFTGPASGAGHLTVVTGKTMGTFYTVKWITKEKIAPDLWQEKVDTCLKGINARLSMYDPKSELSRFNRQPAGKPFRISKDFFHVLSLSRQIHELSAGAWDGTIKPLVDLWGFGTRNRKKDLPSPQAISEALSKTGFHKLKIQNQSLTANAPHVTLDLGSIAKGYGVDVLARLLRSSGIEDFLVEIGGELYGSGKNLKGKAWSVGISRPGKKELGRGIYKIISLDNMAIATSGDYRNFFVQGKKTYSHIINPKTGYPVDNQVVSASVLAPECALADGLATALMVMDVDQGIQMINDLPQVECLVVKAKGNGLEPIRSQGFHLLEP